MVPDQIWVAIRYLLIAGGAYLVGRGKLTAEAVQPLVDEIIAYLGALVTVGVGAWGLYVRWNTKSVEQSVAVPLPVVSPVTGRVGRRPRRAKRG